MDEDAVDGVGHGDVRGELREMWEIGQEEARGLWAGVRQSVDWRAVSMSRDSRCSEINAR